MVPTSLGNVESTISQLSQQALTPSLLPMNESSIVEVHITILEWDNPLSPGPCVLASSLALACAGIPSRGLVIPTTLALSDHVYLDPTASEAQAASAIFDLASIPAMGTVTHVGFRSTRDWKSAPIEPDLFDRCLDLCKFNVELIHGVASTALRDHLSRR
jgi:ribonuclease PH